MKQITIIRYTAIDRITRENWKDLIATLALAGYEVYADEDKLVFTLGDGDEVKEIKK